MQIIDLTSYEKLKIRPVSINDISDGLLHPVFTHMAISKMKFSDLKPGYVVKTRYSWEGTTDNNVYMVFSKKHIMSICKNTFFSEKVCDMILIRSKNGCSSYKELDPYMDNFPRHNRYSKQDITDVWQTNIDETEFHSISEVSDFFDDYDLENIK